MLSNSQINPLNFSGSTFHPDTLTFDDVRALHDRGRRLEDHIIVNLADECLLALESQPDPDRRNWVAQTALAHAARELNLPFTDPTPLCGYSADEIIVGPGGQTLAQAAADHEMDPGWDDRDAERATARAVRESLKAAAVLRAP